jgi:hypothetical protein
MAREGATGSWYEGGQVMRCQERKPGPEREDGSFSIIPCTEEATRMVHIDVGDGPDIMYCCADCAGCIKANDAYTQSAWSIPFSGTPWSPQVIEGGKK